MKHSRASLRETIRVLEIRQAEERKDFNKQLKMTFDSLKPANLIKSTFKDIANHMEMKSNVFEAIIPLMTNFLSAKFLRFGRRNSFYRVIATMIQMSITNFTARHRHTILEIFTNTIDRIKDLFNKARAEAEEEILEQDETTDNSTQENTDSVKQPVKENKRPAN